MECVFQSIIYFPVCPFVIAGILFLKWFYKFSGGRMNIEQTMSETHKLSR